LDCWQDLPEDLCLHVGAEDEELMQFVDEDTCV